MSAVGLPRRARRPRPRDFRMSILGTVPRRCVNLPPGSLGVLVGSILSGKLREGPDLEPFHAELARWLGAPHVFGASSGRSSRKARCD